MQLIRKSHSRRPSCLQLHPPPSSQCRVWAPCTAIPCSPSRHLQRPEERQHQQRRHRRPQHRHRQNNSAAHSIDNDTGVINGVIDAQANTSSSAATSSSPTAPSPSAVTSSSSTASSPSALQRRPQHRQRHRRHQRRHRRPSQQLPTSTSSVEPSPLPPSIIPRHLIHHVNHHGTHRRGILIDLGEATPADGRGGGWCAARVLERSLSRWGF